MNSQLSPLTASLRSRAIKDGVTIACLSVVVYLVSLWYDLFDRVSQWVITHEMLQLNELIIVAVFLVFASAVFVLRRRNELLEQIHARERAQAEKDRMAPVLEQALREVQTLSGMLPVCAWCKKIRDDEGYWSQVDAYLHDHTSIGVTHSICPDCARNPDNGLGGTQPA